jgi:hypothetical protein
MSRRANAHIRSSGCGTMERTHVSKWPLQVKELRTWNLPHTFFGLATTRETSGTEHSRYGRDARLPLAVADVHLARTSAWKQVQGLRTVPGDCLPGGSRDHHAHPPPKLGTVGKRTISCSIRARQARHRPSALPQTSPTSITHDIARLFDANQTVW